MPKSWATIGVYATIWSFGFFNEILQETSWGHYLSIEGKTWAWPPNERRSVYCLMPWSLNKTFSHWEDLLGQLLSRKQYNSSISCQFLTLLNDLYFILVYLNDLVTTSPRTVEKWPFKIKMFIISVKRFR